VYFEVPSKLINCILLVRPGSHTLLTFAVTDGQSGQARSQGEAGGQVPPILCFVCPFMPPPQKVWYVPETKTTGRVMGWVHGNAVIYTIALSLSS